MPEIPSAEGVTLFQIIPPFAPLGLISDERADRTVNARSAEASVIQLGETSTASSSREDIVDSNAQETVELDTQKPFSNAAIHDRSNAETIYLEEIHDLSDELCQARLQNGKLMIRITRLETALQFYEQGRAVFDTLTSDQLPMNDTAAIQELNNRCAHQEALVQELETHVTNYRTSMRDSQVQLEALRNHNSDLQARLHACHDDLNRAQHQKRLELDRLHLLHAAQLWDFTCEIREMLRPVTTE